MYQPNSVIRRRAGVPDDANDQSRVAHERRAGHPPGETGAVLTAVPTTSDGPRGVTGTAVPVRSPVIFLVPAALLGLVAATRRARRAARLDVLAAIASP
jgi:hypothetical protein